MDTWHGLTHALYILAGPLCMCAVVCVSEVGQPRCYLTRPEKTSGELITASCAQTQGNHQSYACKRPAHTRSCEQARTNIWLTFWPHTRRKAHKQIKATCLQACVHAKTVKWVHEEKLKKSFCLKNEPKFHLNNAGEKNMLPYCTDRRLECLISPLCHKSPTVGSTRLCFLD